MKNLLIVILLFLTNRSGKSLRYKDIFAMKQVILFYSTIRAALLLAIEPVPFSVKYIGFSIVYILKNSTSLFGAFSLSEMN